MKILEAGTKVQYLYGGEWKIGVIHGYRQYENEMGLIQMVTYLIDTGEHERIDEYPFDHRSREINRRVNEHVQKHNSTPEQAVEAVLKHGDLPESKMDIERVRQPKQIELSQDFVKET
jgi:hypothetical protein